jgi:hypothetical protein
VERAACCARERGDRHRKNMYRVFERDNGSLGL